MGASHAFLCTMYNIFTLLLYELVLNNMGWTTIFGFVLDNMVVLCCMNRIYGEFVSKIVINILIKFFLHSPYFSYFYCMFLLFPILYWTNHQFFMVCTQSYNQELCNSYLDFLLVVIVVKSIP